VKVDGKPGRTQMVAPSLVGVEVAPGTHRIVFTYEPVPGELYVLLFALGATALIALAALDVRRRTGGRGARRVNATTTAGP
jgi:hypothetical protein